VGKLRKTGLWSVDQRLEFMTFASLGRQGKPQRSSIISGSACQASADLTQYQKEVKHNAISDKNNKTYVAGRVQPVLLRAVRPREYLAQLRMIDADLLSEDGGRGRSASVYTSCPPAAATSNPTLRASYPRAGTDIRSTSPTKP